MIFCSLPIVLVFLVRRLMSVVLNLLIMIYCIQGLPYLVRVLRAALGRLDTFYTVRLEWVGKTIKAPRIFIPENKLCGCCECSLLWWESVLCNVL